MRERAFNLFTALVSFVLIVLALLLAQNMMQTERNTVDIIRSIEEQAEMQAIADLSRADAMQVFNYNMRWQISDYLLEPGNYYILGPEARTWQELQNDFASSKFSGGGAFARYTAKVISSLLGTGTTGKSFGSYNVVIVGSEVEMVGALQKAIDNSVGASEFLQVVGCPDGNPDECNPGTFYVVLDIKSLEEPDYEMLPQILVFNENTGRRIKEPVLPKGKFRIFVPLRLFKAIAIARSIAFAANDGGLFSAGVHNEIEEMRLGMCDAKSCAPREDPYDSANSAIGDTDKYCPGDNRGGDYRVEFSPGSWSRSAGISNLMQNPDAYDASGIGEAANDALKALAQERICGIAKNSIGAERQWDGLELVGSGASACDIAELFSATTQARPSKIIIQDDGGSEGSGDSGHSYSPCSAMRGGTGFYLSDGKVIARGPETGGGDSGIPANPGSTSYCSEVSAVEMQLRFRENNEHYKVNKAMGAEFRIRLADYAYTPFSAKFKSANAAPPTCALSNAPEELAAVDLSEWTCYSRTDITAEPAIGPGGCYPE
ncbi:MAG: hypothetical protein HYW05_04850 [Candidatus Diapherotrites archaeon]|nr:hypothetical protein [Candidatus Diapherotrites archaeon]